MFDLKAVQAILHPNETDGENVALLRAIALEFVRALPLAMGVALALAVVRWLLP